MTEDNASIPRRPSAETRRWMAALAMSAAFWTLALLLLRVLPFSPDAAPVPSAAELAVAVSQVPSSFSLPRPVSPTAVPSVPAAARRIPSPGLPARAAEAPAAADPSPIAAAEPAAAPRSEEPPSDAVPADRPAAAPPPEGAGTGTPSASTLALLNEAIRRDLKYPPQARRRNIEGKVEIDLAVGADGTLAGCVLAAGSGSGILDEAALRLIRGLFPLRGASGGAFSTRIAIEYRLK